MSERIFNTARAREQAVQIVETAVLAVDDNDVMDLVECAALILRSGVGW